MSSFAPTPPGPPPPQDNTAASMDAAINPPSAMSAPQSPHPAVSMPKESWGRSVYHGVLSALGGTNNVSMSRDPSGAMNVSVGKMGPGQQWKNIIAGALTGYAAAAATGAHGPGSTSAKLGAGFQAGQGRVQQQFDRMRAEANEDLQVKQQTALANARTSALAVDNATKSFQLGRDQIKATEEDLGRENTFAQIITQGGEGSEDLGNYKNFDEVREHFKNDPRLHDHLAGGRLIAIPHVGENGKIDGIHAALVTDDWMHAHIDQEMPISVPTYDDKGNLTKKTLTIPKGVLTGEKYVQMTMQQSADSLKQHQLNVKEEQTAAAAAQKAKDDQAKLEETKRYHSGELQLGQERVDVEREKAKAAKYKFGDDPEADADLVDRIGTGHMDVGNMAYLMSRNQPLVDAVAKKYPDFDSSKIKSYAKTYQDYTSGPVSKQLNSGNTALKHLAELDRMNTAESHIPGTPDYNAFMNKADTVSHELAQFYGNSTIPAIEGIKNTLTKQWWGNRHAAIMTQAKSMGDKFDTYENQWRSAAPSAQYRNIPMPGMDAEAQHERATLDPNYSARLQGGGAAQPQPQGGGAAPPPPAPSKGVFNSAKWAQANPGKDVEAAKAEAQRQGYEVK